MLTGVHQVRQLGPAGADLFRDVAPSIASVLTVGLFERLPDRCRDHRMLAFGDVGESIAHPVNPAALPGCFEHTRDGGFEAGMGIADHKLHAVETAGLQRAQEVRPESFCFRRADTKANDFPAALGIGGHGDYGRNRDDPPALALLEIGGIEPDIGPLPRERAVQELADPLVNILAQLGHRALGDAAQSHGLHKIINASGRDAAAADPGLSRITATSACSEVLRASRKPGK